MDKYEYKVRVEQIKALIKEEDYVQAAQIADTIDWRRVKSVAMLCTISDLYKINRRFEDARDLLLLAYDRHPGGRSICYSLCELSIKLEEFPQAVEYYKEFVQEAPRDTGRYILQYKLYEAQNVNLEERIAVLEEYKKREYKEKWAYELAYLYHRIGLGTKCVEECDELILWFGSGKYVTKAMELKMLHEPLTPAQQSKYDNRYYEGEGEAAGVQENVEEIPEEAAAEEPGEAESAETGRKTPQEQVGESAFSGVAPAAPTRVYGESYVKEVEEALAGSASSAEKPSDEMDIQVKTMDVSEYNTLNLQKELAEGLKEVLHEEQRKAQGEKYEGEPDSRAGYEGTETAESMEESVQFGIEGEGSWQEGTGAESEEYWQEETGAEEEEYWQEGTGAESQEYWQEETGIEGEEGWQEETGAEGEEYWQEETGAEGEEYWQEGTGAESEEYWQEGTGVESEEYWQEETGIEGEEGWQEETGAEGEEGWQEETGAEGEEGWQEETGAEGEEGWQEETGAEGEGGWQEGTGTEGEENWQEGTRIEGEEGWQAGTDNPADGETGAAQEDSAAFTKVFAEVLSMESDGQIRMVIPEEERHDAQIEGQITLEEVLNASGQEEDLAGEGDTEEFEELEEIEDSAELEEITGAEEETELEEVTGAGEETEPEEVTEAGGKAEFTDFSVELETDYLEDTDEDVTAEAEEKQKTEPVKEPKALKEPDSYESAKASKNAPVEREPAQVRDLTHEERELFGAFLQNRSDRVKLIKALDTISMAAYTGNVIVTGDEGLDIFSFAKNIILYVQMSDTNFSGKTAKISGEAINKESVEKILTELENGALIIQEASAMDEKTCGDLYRGLQRESRGIIVILEDTRRAMNKFLAKNKKLAECFNARVDMEALSDDMLVAFGKKYANELEYTIDEMGILALHTRIHDMQSSSHAVTIMEVKEIVDGAIKHANRKNLKHFCDILLAKRYDEEDMIILREKDFLS